MSEPISAMIARERLGVAGLLDGLTDAQWEAPSLCAGWRVREVVAHLVMPFTVPTWRFGLHLLARGGNFDRVMDERARADVRAPAELAATLRANAWTPFRPPGPKALPRMLADVVVHGQDIARPLGIARPVPPATAEVVLELLVHPLMQRYYGGVVTRGLALVTDDGWRRGEGLEATGSAAALITVLARRRAALDELGGPGAPQLRERATGTAGGARRAG